MNRFGAPPEHSLNMLLLVRVRPYRDDHWEALEFRFGLEPQTGRMSELGHVPTFATPLHDVWNAAMNRHSGLNVGNGTVSGP